jgi:hypothetical protein
MQYKREIFLPAFNPQRLARQFVELTSHENGALSACVIRSRFMSESVPAGHSCYPFLEKYRAAKVLRSLSSENSAEDIASD